MLRLQRAQHQPTAIAAGARHAHPDAARMALDGRVVLQPGGDIALALRMLRDVVRLDHLQSFVAGEEAGRSRRPVRARDAAVVAGEEAVAAERVVQAVDIGVHADAEHGRGIGRAEGQHASLQGDIADRDAAFLRELDAFFGGRRERAAAEHDTVRPRRVHIDGDVVEALFAQHVGRSGHQLRRRRAGAGIADAEEARRHAVAGIVEHPHLRLRLRGCGRFAGGGQRQRGQRAATRKVGSGASDGHLHEVGVRPGTRAVAHPQADVAAGRRHPHP